MSTTAALTMIVVAAIAYIAASVWAARRQARWMADKEEEFKNRKK
ncbi:hypothetical protein [Cupriavidus sp.]|nr:hypothetical protein [Cupriavidus sp.]